MTDQVPDPEPGHYYVSALDGNRLALLAGPFCQHKEALAWVDQARSVAHQVDPWSWFYAFGTVRRATGNRAGVLNTRLGITPADLTGATHSGGVA